MEGRKDIRYYNIEADNDRAAIEKCIDENFDCTPDAEYKAYDTTEKVRRWVRNCLKIIDRN